MYGTLPISGPGNGIFPPSLPHFAIRNATAATAFTAGMVVQLDIQQTVAGTSSFVPGHQTAGVDDSIYVQCILPTATGIKSGILFVCEQAIAVGATGPASLANQSITANLDGSGTTITKGAPLVASTAGTLLIAPASGAGKIVGYLLSTASVTTVTTGAVWFDGYHGFAQNAT